MGFVVNSGVRWIIGFYAIKATPVWRLQRHNIVLPTRFAKEKRRGRLFLAIGFRRAILLDDFNRCEVSTREGFPVAVVKPFAIRLFFAPSLYAIGSSDFDSGEGATAIVIARIVAHEGVPINRALTPDLCGTAARHDYFIAHILVLAVILPLILAKECVIIRAMLAPIAAAIYMLALIAIVSAMVASISFANIHQTIRVSGINLAIARNTEMVAMIVTSAPFGVVRPTIEIRHEIRALRLDLQETCAFKMVCLLIPFFIQKRTQGSAFRLAIAIKAHKRLLGWPDDSARIDDAITFAKRARCYRIGNSQVTRAIDISRVVREMLEAQRHT